MKNRDLAAGHPGVPGEAERELRRLRKRVAELENVRDFFRGQYEELMQERDILREALRLVCKDTSRNAEHYLSMAAAQQLLSGLGEETE